MIERVTHFGQLGLEDRVVLGWNLQLNHAYSQIGFAFELDTGRVIKFATLTVKVVDHPE